MLAPELVEKLKVSQIMLCDIQVRLPLRPGSRAFYLGSAKVPTATGL